jgi:D-alanyl-D-alanine carboxypeptidase
MLTAAVLALGLVAVPGAVHAQPPRPGGIDTDLLEAELDDFASLADHTVIVEVREGDETWSEAIGPRSLDAGAREAKPGDRVRVGSVTKSMTAAILLQLQGEGALDLDDSLSAYLPDLLPYDEEPTIRQIMNHTSGLGDFLPRLYPSLAEGDISDVREGYQTHYAPEELIDLGTQDPMPFDPGEGWSYSNTGYTALGLLIEAVTGNTLGYELEERIFEPADLDRTYFPQGDTSGIHGPHLTPYITTGESEEPYFDTTALSSTQLWAGGGVVSTMGDFNDFYRALTDGTLLTEQQLSEATQFVATGKSFQYGLGLFGRRLDCPGNPDEVVFGHDGDALGHETFSYHSLDAERQITVAWNIGDKHGYTDPDAFDAALDDLLEAALCDAGAPPSDA